MTLRQDHKNHPQRKFENQEGVTLLLSILILAAIIAIVFSISSIILNEIKTSGDLSKTEPAITADEAIAEDQLYKTMRGLSAGASCNSPTVTTLNQVQVSTCIGYYLPNPYGFSLGTTSPSNRRDFYLYNPAVVGGDPGYTGVTVRLISGAGGTIYFCTFDVPDCVSNPNIDSKTLNQTQTSWTSPALSTSTEYQLVVINGSSTPGDYSVQGSPNGMPAGVTTIENSAGNQGITRDLQVTVPQ